MRYWQISLNTMFTWITCLAESIIDEIFHSGNAYRTSCIGHDVNQRIFPYCRPKKNGRVSESEITYEKFHRYSLEYMINYAPTVAPEIIHYPQEYPRGMRYWFHDMWDVFLVLFFSSIVVPQVSLIKPTGLCDVLSEPVGYILDQARHMRHAKIISCIVPNLTKRISRRPTLYYDPDF